MKKVLILTGRYLPGYKDGGPVRSILNLTEWMGDDYDIRIMCLDRDHGDEKPYEGIVINAWNRVGKASVYYTEKHTETRIEELAKDVDLVYCCGPYSDYAIAAMKLKKNNRFPAPLVVASMGSFSPDAFAIKGFKKSAFVKVMKNLGYFKKVTWSVTSEREEQELKDILGGNQKCIIASDLARKGSFQHINVKRDDILKVIFLSRISRKKNLIVVPDILEKISGNGNVRIDVYGIAEDKEYLEECLAKFRQLPDSIKWEYKGEINSEGVPGIFAEYDVFLFPTLGENYGHVIAESLAAGCVPVISDRTPWMDLDEHGCGHVCQLENLESFSRALSELATTNGESFAKLVGNCYAYIDNKNKQEAANSGYRTIFDTVR